jgi:hypothetical protein
MNKFLFKMFSVVMILSLMLMALPVQGAQAASTDVVISEFRVRGPNGAADEFVELYNLSASPVDIGGWLVRGSNSSSTIGTRATIPSGTILNPGCYYLVTNSSTSGGPYSGAVPGDLTFTTGITDDGGIAITLPGGTTIVDQVGMSTGSAYKEGTTLASLGSSNLNRGYERKPGGSAGSGLDTDDNSNDFQLITPSDPQNSASTCVDNSEPTSPKINEFSASTAGTDVEYVEIIGAPNADYSAYTILEIEGDSGATVGIVDEVINLGTTDANGLYLVNLAASALENGSLTLLLVKNFTGALNTDLDTDNDGVFDITPWDAIVDSVAVNDGGAGDVTYGTPTLGVAYDGLPFAPGGASRVPDGFDTDAATDWVRNDFDLAGIPGFDGTPEVGEAYNTPGRLNEVVPQINLGTVVISQVYGGGGNSGATYTHDFIELYNQTSSSVDLTGWSVQYASATGTSWQVTGLSGSIASGGYYLIQQAAGAGGTTPLPAPDATGSIAMSATAGKVALANNTTALSGACPTESVIVDFVGFGSTANCYEGSGPAPAPSNTMAIFRKDGGNQDTDNNSDNFETGIPNPRNSSFGTEDTAPEVTSTYPANSATDFATTADLTVTFSEAVALAGNWFDLTCSTSGSVTAAVSGGPTTFTLNPDVDLLVGETCTLTIYAANVTDQDANDPPDNMVSDFTVGFSTLDVCSLTYTPIYAIQGSGLVTPIPGAVTTQGVVVGDYEGPSPTLRGFYIQDLSGDGDVATSDGIFVFNGNNDNVNLGDVVRVTGTAAEYQDQTQVSASSVVKCGTGTVAPVDVTFPVPSLTYLERYEGMLVRLPQTMYVTEHFQLGRFGQVLLSSGGRLQQPTNVVAPGGTAIALQADNNLNKIILDDDLQNQNPDPILFGRGGLPLSASNTLRGGDTVTGVVGILTYTWSGNAASGNAYRLRPINVLGGSVPDFQPANPRPASAPDVGGTVKVVGMNLLNFFNTFNDGNAGTPGCFPSGNDSDCRGASNATEFARQYAKTVAAILAMNPDVLGVNELENDGYGPTSSIQFLVDQLNAATAPGTYAFIDVDANTGQVNVMGTDAIRVAILYKPGVVTPVGQTAPLNSVAFVNGGDPAPRNRVSLAQAFQQNSNGAVFIVNVNHLKSKGSACTAPDAGDGQGNCNQVRLNAVTELMNWFGTDPTGTGDPDIIMVGDYNSYAMEDPIIALENGGFTHLIKTFLGPDAYSYVFDGQWGYLDHALASASLASQVTGVADYHINADEPSVLDYLEDFKSAGQLINLYAPDEFRVSDHDPVIIGLKLNAPPTVDASGPYAVDEGSSVTLTATGNDPDGDTLVYAWDLDNDGTFEAGGQSVSFAGVDGPAIYTVGVQVTDEGGLSATATAIVTVNNLAPLVGPITAPTSPVKTGVTVNSSASFTDAGILDTHTALWDWGDGSTSSGVVTETNGSGSVTGSHSYAEAGLYPITLTVTDKDGGSSQSIFEAVIVYNPSGGFITGGGWINSPAGAYLEKPTRKGPALAAFAVKYLRSSSIVPTGNFEFLFLAGNLQFQATSFDWLVVDQTSKTAQFQGTGRINGKGSYKFMVWADDNRPDKMRIKIWKTDGTLIYDTGSNLPLLSGSIVVHR